MEIGPLKDDTIVHESPQRKPESCETSTDENEPADDVTLSIDVTGRLDKLADEATTKTGMEYGDRDTTRLDEIRDRIDSGFYDQQVVKEKMVDKLLDEMLDNINKFYR
jgi:anti-sigma28 factor (negative regulator of flagellin synthesis)